MAVENGVHHCRWSRFLGKYESLDRLQNVDSGQRLVGGGDEQERESEPTLALPEVRV